MSDLESDYRKVFESPEGRRVLRDLARYANVMVSVSSKYPEPHTIAYAEGMRAVFWHVFGKVYDPRKEAVKTEEGFTPIVDGFQNLRKETP